VDHDRWFPLVEDKEQFLNIFPDQQPRLSNLLRVAFAITPGSANDQRIAHKHFGLYALRYAISEADCKSNVDPKK
jgi:hypothetical protein